MGHLVAMGAAPELRNVRGAAELRGWLLDITEHHVGRALVAMREEIELLPPTRAVEAGEVDRAGRGGVSEAARGEVCAPAEARDVLCDGLPLSAGVWQFRSVYGRGGGARLAGGGAGRLGDL